MPEYILRCKNGHERWMVQPMITNQPVICVECGSFMWRKPQPQAVIWNGLKPSQGEHSAEFRHHFENADRIRDEVDAKYRERDGHG